MRNAATAVAARVREIRAEDRAVARRAASEKALKVRQRAEAEVAAAVRAETKRITDAKADAIAKELESKGPWVEVHLANGKVAVYALGSPDQVRRGFAIEGAKRAAFKAVNAHLARVVASRNALAVQPATDFFSADLHAEAGQLYAFRAGVLSIRNEV